VPGRHTDTQTQTRGHTQAPQHTCDVGVQDVVLELLCRAAKGLKRHVAVQLPKARVVRVVKRLVLLRAQRVMCSAARGAARRTPGGCGACAPAGPLTAPRGVRAATTPNKQHKQRTPRPPPQRPTKPAQHTHQEQAQLGRHGRGQVPLMVQRQGDALLRGHAPHHRQHHADHLPARRGPDRRGACVRARVRRRQQGAACLRKPCMPC
jgi:hypothetical protein